MVLLLSTSVITKSAYIPAVDGLRAVSILGVLAFHGIGFLKPIVGKNGWLGVDVFFVISGFLITRLAIRELERSQNLDYKRFYWHRILRITPAFYFLLAFYLLFNPFASPSNAAAIIAAAVHLTDYDVALGWGNAVSSGLAICWSLAVEEKFYLLFPLMMFAYKRLRSPWLFAFLIVVCQIWKAYVIGTNPEWLRLSAAFDTRFDNILVGCLAASFFDGRCKFSLATEQNRLRWFNQPYISLPLFLCAWYWMCHFLNPAEVVGQLPRNLYWIGFVPAFSFVCAALLIVITSNHDCLKHVNDPVSTFLALPALVWLGRISYSLYLWHSLAFHVVEKQTHLQGPLLDLAKFALAITLAAASYYFVERPFLALKKNNKGKVTPLPAMAVPVVGDENQLVGAGKSSGA